MSLIDWDSSPSVQSLPSAPLIPAPSEVHFRNECPQNLGTAMENNPFDIVAQQVDDPFGLISITNSNNQLSNNRSLNNLLKVQSVAKLIDISYEGNEISGIVDTTVTEFKIANNLQNGISLTGNDATEDIPSDEVLDCDFASINFATEEDVHNFAAKRIQALLRSKVKSTNGNAITSEAGHIIKNKGDSQVTGVVKHLEKSCSLNEIEFDSSKCSKMISRHSLSCDLSPELYENLKVRTRYSTPQKLIYDDEDNRNIEIDVREGDANSKFKKVISKNERRRSNVELEKVILEDHNKEDLFFEKPPWLIANDDGCGSKAGVQMAEYSKTDDASFHAGFPQSLNVMDANTKLRVKKCADVGTVKAGPMKATLPLKGMTKPTQIQSGNAYSSELQRLLSSYKTRRETPATPNKEISGYKALTPSLTASTSLNYTPMRSGAKTVAKMQLDKPVTPAVKRSSICSMSGQAAAQLSERKNRTVPSAMPTTQRSHSTQSLKSPSPDLKSGIQYQNTPLKDNRTGRVLMNLSPMKYNHNAPPPPSKMPTLRFSPMKPQMPKGNTRNSTGNEIHVLNNRSACEGEAQKSKLRRPSSLTRNKENVVPFKM